MNDDLRKRLKEAHLIPATDGMDVHMLDGEWVMFKMGCDGLENLLEDVEAELTRAREEAHGKGRLEVMNERWSLMDELCDALGIERGRKLEDGVVQEALAKIRSVETKSIEKCIAELEEQRKFYESEAREYKEYSKKMYDKYKVSEYAVEEAIQALKELLPENHD